MVTKSSSSLCFSLLLLLFHSTFALNLINDTCKRAAKGDPSINFEFCMNVIGSIPKAHWSNRRSLGRISINLTKSNSTHTVQYIEEILVENWDPYVKSCLVDCLKRYGNAVSSLTQAFESFRHKLYDDANVQVNAAMDDAMSCEGRFKEKKGVVHPLKQRNDDMFQLGAIVLAIINMLVK